VLVYCATPTMKPVDTNILVYAHRRDMAQHTLALRAIQGLVAEGRTWAVPWP
jgi:predicted nucleic acid-binding protein